MGFSGGEIDIGKFPQGFAMAPFAVGKLTDELGGVCPIPGALSALLKLLSLLLAYLDSNPIAALSFDEVDRPSFTRFDGEGSRQCECRLHRLRG